MKPPNLHPPQKDLRLFALLLLLPALLFFYKFHLPVVAYILGGLAVLGALIPLAIKPVHNLLVLLTWPIGYVISNILMAVIYYGILTPIALFKKRPLDLTYPPKEKSNFTPLPEKAPKTYYDPF